MFQTNLRQDICCSRSVYLYFLFPCLAGFSFSHFSLSLSCSLSAQMSRLSLSVSFIRPPAAPSIKEIVPVLVNIKLSKPAISPFLSFLSNRPLSFSMSCLILSFSCFHPSASFPLPLTNQSMSFSATHEGFVKKPWRLPRLAPIVFSFLQCLCACVRAYVCVYLTLRHKRLRM